jgi:DnaJ-class molecular chaperone
MGCDNCEGSGEIPFAIPQKNIENCTHCSGSGVDPREMIDYGHKDSRSQAKLSKKPQCTVCLGTGKNTEVETVQIRLTPKMKKQLKKLLGKSNGTISIID